MELVPFETVIAMRGADVLPPKSSQYKLSIILALCLTILFSILFIQLSRDASIQSQRDALSWCYPSTPPLIPNTKPLVLTTAPSAHNFTTAARGWSSWGIQADPGTTPSFTTFNQEFVHAQCQVLTEPDLVAAGYELCALDSGWSDPEVTDEYGRIWFKEPEFDLVGLGDKLHEMGLKMGVYILPGFPCSALDKTIKDTNPPVKLRDVWNGNVLGFGFCDFAFSSQDGTVNLGVQEYFNSIVELWAQWGVDMIKLDYMTPGSPRNNGHLVRDNSLVAVAYNRAIVNSGRQIRLDLSWKLCRTEEYMEIWSSTAESMRLDQDLDTYNGKQFANWRGVQRTVENYRQFVTLLASRSEDGRISIHPDLDNLFVGNNEGVSGLSDEQRVTVMSLWIGASANLILGNDLRNLDALGRGLITSPESVEVGKFCGEYPMVPRNPGTGGWEARQLQAWISGPSGNGMAVVLLVNMGPNRGEAGFKTRWRGLQRVEITVGELGLDELGDCWIASDVWSEEGGAVSEVDVLNEGRSLEAWLDEGESRMVWLRLC